MMGSVCFLVVVQPLLLKDIRQAMLQHQMETQEHGLELPCVVHAVNMPSCAHAYMVQMPDMSEQGTEQERGHHNQVAC